MYLYNSKYIQLYFSFFFPLIFITFKHTKHFVVEMIVKMCLKN